MGGGRPCRCCGAGRDGTAGVVVGEGDDRGDDRHRISPRRQVADAPEPLAPGVDARDGKPGTGPSCAKIWSRWAGAGGPVSRDARSYLRGALRYDRAELRTTGSAGSTTAPDYVRPRGFAYDREKLVAHGDETGHAPRHPGLHRPAARDLRNPRNAAGPMPTPMHAPASSARRAPGTPGTHPDTRAPGRIPPMDGTAQAGILRGYDDDQPHPRTRRTRIRPAPPAPRGRMLSAWAWLSAWARGPNPPVTLLVVPGGPGLGQLLWA